MDDTTTAAVPVRGLDAPAPDPAIPAGAERRAEPTAAAGGTGRLLRIGGLCALLIATGYVATIPLFALAGAPPTGAEARLAYHAAAGATWWAIVVLSVLTDLLFVPLALALAVRLWPSAPAAAAIGGAFTFLFVALDLSVTWPAYAALISLGMRYGEAVTEADRLALVASAGYPAAILSSPLQAVSSILTLSLGILATGIGIWRSGSGRAAATAAVAAGIAGTASVVETAVTGAVSPLAIVASILTIAWLVLVAEVMLRPRRPRTMDGDVSVS